MNHQAAQREIGRGNSLRVFALATVPGLLAGVIGTLLVASWRDRLPNPVATHWSVHGPNGFSGQAAVLVIPIVIGVIAAIVGALLVRGVTDPAVARTVVGIVDGVAIGTVVIAVSTTAVQRGVVDAHTVDTPTWPIAWSLVVGVAAGIGCAALVPRWEVAAPGGAANLPRADLGANERFLWTRTVTTSPVASALMGTAVVVVAGFAFVTRAWPTMVIAALLLVSAALMWSVRVSVDQTGVTVRSAAGWPRIHIPASSIDHAEVRRIRALRDFGGYGYRISVRGDLKGAKGFVLRSGPALLIFRTDGRRDVVVVDDAQTAASLVNHVVDRAGPAAGPQAGSAR